MSQLHSLVSTVIASAMDRAAKGAGKGDLAQGLLAGLRRLRTMVGVQAGYAAACSLDDAIHEVVVERSLDAFGSSGGATVLIPGRSPRVLRACAILEDAAMSCLALNAYFPGNTALNLSVRLMAERLVDCLGGVPEWCAVMDELHCHEAEDEEAASEERWTSVAVH